MGPARGPPAGSNPLGRAGWEASEAPCGRPLDHAQLYTVVCLLIVEREGRVEPLLSLSLSLARSPLSFSPLTLSRRFEESSFLTTHRLIIVMIVWTGLAPWDFEFPFSGSLTSTFRRFEPSSSCSRGGCFTRMATVSLSLSLSLVQTQTLPLLLPLSLSLSLIFALSLSLFS